VRPLTGAIDQLLQLKGVAFEWKDPAEHENHVGTQTDFIAQDVEKVFPEWVKEDGYTAPLHQKYKTRDARQIEALEVESFREPEIKGRRFAFKSFTWSTRRERGACTWPGAHTRA
jgi:hypothetical protein